MRTTTINIIDLEKLIPDHEHLLHIVHSHPFDKNLSTKIITITVERSERYGIAREAIYTDEINKHITLKVEEKTAHKDNYDFILYHEFGHVADRFNSKFKYSEDKKKNLTTNEQFCVMEIWNEYINSRLNKFNLYVPSGKDCGGTIDGKLHFFKLDIEGELLSHISMLQERGFSFKSSRRLVNRIWEKPDYAWTYPQIIKTVCNNLKNTGN